MDEIGMLARNYQARHGVDAFPVIDAQIADALGRGNWPDVLKWQRVKLRIRRQEAQGLRAAY